MNPLNTQKQPPTAQYFMTGMTSLTTATSKSVLKTNTLTSTPATTGSQQHQQTIITTTLNNGNGKNNNAVASGNNILDTTKYVTNTTNYLPVLLTNQTLISSVGPGQLQPQQHLTKITPGVISHAPSNIMSSTSATNLPVMTSSNKQMVITPSNNANISYQVLGTTQSNNVTPLITSPNGTVSVLLTPSQPITTAGHVAAPIIIRNPPTTVTTTTKASQIKQQLPINQQHQSQLMQQQHQLQGAKKMHAFNPQSFNPDILKQIVVGNTGTGATATLAPGTTLLKPAILQNKPTIPQQQQQQTQKKTIVNNKMLITTPQQQQQVKNINHTVITKSSDNSTQKFAALGMELVKASHAVAHTNATQNIQKLPQVSLLQNSAKTSTSLVENKSNSVTTSKNSNEIKVGNLNSEVSLIKKPNMSIEKSLEASLLKNSNKIQAENKQIKQQFIDNSKKNTLPTNNDKVLKDTTTESYSLLKTFKDPIKISDTEVSNAKPLNKLVEKQKSLLKPKNKKSPEAMPKEARQQSPRSQRSSSCNIVNTENCVAKNNVNERRHSEPSKIESVQNFKSTPSDKPNQQMDVNKSEELDILFEDEEYLESSGEKSTDISDISAVNSSSNEQHAKIESKKISNQDALTKDNITTVSDKAYDLPNQIQENSKQSQNNEIQNMDRLNKENKTTESNTDSDDDDVTILPMEDIEIEQIEIDDDDDEEENIAQNNKSPSPEAKHQLNASLLCDEQIHISSASSMSNNSSDQISSTTSHTSHKSPKMEPLSTPLLKKTLMEPKSLIHKDEPQSNGYSSVLDMLSNFNMLNWRERIGTARGTNLKFQLNEFNLIQLFERNLDNKRIHTAYEKPIYERESSHRRAESKEAPVYYMCRRCNVQGPSVDFLAPEFCSLACLKRDSRKRRDNTACIIRKRNRYSTNNNSLVMGNAHANNLPPLTYIDMKLPKFRWANYLKNNMTAAAPISLFLNPFPTGPNSFIIGMKLEAIDPDNCSLFCVCTIIDIMGYRLKLSFDGYDSAYDFWLNADSMDIFPPGWCAKTNRILQPPKGINANKFNWGTYLNKEKALPAPRHLFTHLNSSSLVPRNPFKVGMHLEAEDLNDTGKLCVASVADVLDDRIRIHFDGWDDCYDIIVDINSPYIHPCGWHEGRQQLVVPPDCENSAFNWADYIRKENTGVAASEELFNPREPIGFKPGMKLEVVDPRNPSLIRPATVVSHKGHRVKLHLDCWPNDYCFWLEDDSPDLHPVGWCDATGHDLEPPPGFQMGKQKMPCTVTGCRGIGNAQKAFMSVHASRDGCPYAAENWRNIVEKPQRVSYENIVKTLPKVVKQCHTQQMQTQQPRLNEHQILERLHMLDNIKTRNVLIQQDKLPTNQNNCFGFPLANLKREEKNDSNIVPAQSTSNSTSLSQNAQQQIHKPDTKLDVNLEIAKEFLYDYGPRLHQNYNLWQKNFTFDAEKIKRNPLNWSTTEVSVFVDLYLDCRKTATLFNQEDIDGEAFLSLQQQDLTDRLGLKLGPAVKLYTCILQLRTLTVTKFEVPFKQVTLKK